MQTRKLGNTDLKLTTVGLGTWILAQQDTEEIEQLLAKHQEKIDE